MRLNKYIMEVKDTPEDIDKQISIIKKNCSKILKLYRNDDRVFVRENDKLRSKSFWEKKAYKTVRPPKDTPIEIHRALNKLFKEKFGWKVRDGIFTQGTSWPMCSDYYGIFIFFPVDKFKFAWSPTITDLFTRLPTRKNVPKYGKGDWVKELLPRLNDLVNGFKDTNLKGALDTNHETVFKCSKYYLLTCSRDNIKKLYNDLGLMVFKNRTN